MLKSNQYNGTNTDSSIYARIPFPPATTLRGNWCIVVANVGGGGGDEGSGGGGVDSGGVGVDTVETSAEEATEAAVNGEKRTDVADLGWAAVNRGAGFKK